MHIRESIEDLYQRRYRSFCHGAAAIIGDYGVAHDVVQEAFAQALAKGRTYRGGLIDAWVWKIVVSRAHDELRRRSRVGGPSDDVETSFDLSEDSDLARAIRQLPERRRLVLFLRYFADLSYEEIAVFAGMSTGTVAATLNQTRAELRAILEPEGVQQ